MELDTKPLPSPKELRQAYPLSPESAMFIQNSRKQICNILDGSDPRLLLIVGPCSIHDVNAAKQYAMHLKELIRQTEDTFLTIMRVYFEKPRTVLGWKGMLYDPYLDGSHDIEYGLQATRKLLVDLADLEVAAATEILDPFTVSYYSDLISWGCIGARTSSSQIHRQLVSGLPVPVAFKNSTDGNIGHAVNGIKAASVSHGSIGIDDAGQAVAQYSKGNSHAHLVLRGGENRPNYDPQSLLRAQSLLRDAGLKEQLIIDCSHDNCGRIHEHQRTVFQSVLAQRISGNKAIKGLILESNLQAGNQELNKNSLRYGVSVTDPCIDWAMTEQLVMWGRAKMVAAIEEPIIEQDSAATLCIVE